MSPALALSRRTQYSARSALMSPSFPTHRPLPLGWDYVQTGRSVAEEFSTLRHDEFEIVLRNPHAACDAAGAGNGINHRALNIRWRVTIAGSICRGEKDVTLRMAPAGRAVTDRHYSL